MFEENVMENNQAKIKEASSLLKDIDEHNYDFDKQLQLINKANSLIAAVNSDLNLETQQDNVTKSKSNPAPTTGVKAKRQVPQNSASKVVYQDNKVTATFSEDSQNKSLDVSDKNSSEISNGDAKSHVHQASNGNAIHAHPSSSEVHMSRKQYREMLKKQSKK